MDDVEPVTPVMTAPAAPTALAVPPDPVLLAHEGQQDCGCGAAASGMPATTTYIYAIGSIEARFPTLSVEKEFAQAVGQTDTAGMTDQQVLGAVLSDPHNRYLVRQMCWVLVIGGIDTYLVHPRDARDFDLLVESIRPEPSPLDLDVVIGMQGPLARPDTCNGLIVPIVLLEQTYSFDRESFANSVPRAAKQSQQQAVAGANQVLSSILQLADNTGATDAHRALNYLVTRYADIYTATGERFATDFALSGVDVRDSHLGGTRKVVDCVFTYTDRKNAFVEKVMVPVDVTERFPFLAGKLRPYYDR